MRYISIVGTTGSGKSTLARQLAKKLNTHYIELDNLLWLDDWKESENEALFAKLHEQMQNGCNGWVIDNMYTRVNHMIWSQADTIIWLDYSFTLNFYRLFKRTLGRAISRKPLWIDSNNKESWKVMFSKQSIFIWMLQVYQKNRRKYSAMMQDPQYQHIQFIHLTSPKQAEQLIKNIAIHHQKQE